MVETLNQIRADWDRKKAVKDRKIAIKNRKDSKKDRKDSNNEGEEIQMRRKSILNMDKGINH